MNGNIISHAGQAVSVCAKVGSGTNPPRRILVVDDDVDIRRFNTDTLIQSGYDVDAAEDGDAAWEHASTATATIS